MSDTYLKVGVTGTRYFYDQNPITGLPVTGNTSASYTVQLVKTGTGGQSTTGITGPTEVSAGSNAGVYSLSISGTTGFLAATGVYELKIFRVADLTLVWNETIIVTSDGTGAGTYGIASFTATASNGRVVVGGVALAGATVLIQTAAGVIYSMTTSSATGLWGPVFFDADGTYTVYAYKTGYTTTSGTIVVAGAVATGPGADLTIVGASSGSTVLVSTLQSYVRRVMLDAIGSKSDTLTLEVINEAAEMVFMEAQSPYWQKIGVIELLAPYETGTLTLTAGSAVVTFSGSTIPSWVGAGSDLFIPSLGNWYRISTNDSSSQVTVTDAYNGTTTASLAFMIAKVRYTLPTGCARTNDLLFGTLWPYATRMTSAARLEMLKDAWQTSDAITSSWAIEKDYLCVWPPPKQYRRVNFLYFGKPAQVTSGSDTLDWPAEQVLLLRRAIDLCAALRGSTVSGGIEAARKTYNETKAIALAWDKTTAQVEPESVMNGFGSDGFNSLGWGGAVTTV